MSFFEELKRRNVARMAVLYVVASWVILQVADVLFDALELPAIWTRLILAMLILGLPLALIFSWVYEMTPDGLKREKDVDRSQSITPQTGRKINVLIVILLIIAIATVVVDRLLPETAPVASTQTAEPLAQTDAAGTKKPADPAELAAGKFAPPPDRSVAVLPFANRSAREEDAYFVDGIHDDILTQLARIGSLTVISRTSVEKFRGTSLSMKEIGATLGVKSILEGGVQRAGDRVRINVQLIDVATDDHLWADTYDRELTTANIFAIQSEISTAIAQSLKATLSPEEKEQLDNAQTGNMAALEAYFLGRQAMERRTSASLAEAVQHFQRAIALDPQYALAYVGLADTYTLQSNYSGLSRQEQSALAEPLIARALEINDRLGEAYISRAGKAADDNDDATAEALYRKGVELAPGYVQGRHWYGNFLAGTGRPAEGLVQLEEAARLDPLAPIVRSSIGGALERLGRLEEARRQYESTLRIDPEFAAAYNSLGLLDMLTGHLDDALVRARQATALDPGNPSLRFLEAIAWQFLGGLAAASEQSGIVLATTPDDQFMLWYLGLNDLAEDRAETAVARYESVYPALSSKTDPVVDSTNYQVAANLAYLLLETGDEDRVAKLLDRALAVTKTLPRMGPAGFGLNDVIIYSMRGDDAQALAALRAAADDGWLVMFRFDERITRLADEPGYQAIMTEINAMLAAQLERARKMEADGELAPPPE
jgi:TolB-like protein